MAQWARLHKTTLCSYIEPITETNPALSFEWDDEKAASNLTNHRVAFEDAARVFFDPARVHHYDGLENYDEDRFLAIGLVGNVEMVVIYTMRDENIRLISARKANRNEQRDYWKNR